MISFDPSQATDQISPLPHTSPSSPKHASLRNRCGNAPSHMPETDVIMSLHFWPGTINHGEHLLFPHALTIPIKLASSCC